MNVDSYSLCGVGLQGDVSSTHTTGPYTVEFLVCVGMGVGVGVRVRVLAGTAEERVGRYVLIMCVCCAYNTVLQPGNNAMIDVHMCMFVCVFVCVCMCDHVQCRRACLICEGTVTVHTKLLNFNIALWL